MTKTQALLPRLLFFLFAMALLSSCRYDSDTFLKPKFNNHSVIPVAKGRLTPFDDIPDTNLLTDKDGFFRYIMEQELTAVKVDTLVNLSGVQQKFTFNFDDIQLDPVKDTTSISLGRMVEDLDDTSTRDSIYSNNGKSVPFPAITDPPVAPHAVIIENIDFVEMRSGDLVVTVENELPVKISNCQFELRNKSTNELIASTLLDINAGQKTIPLNFSLDNKTIRQELQVLLKLNIEDSGGNPVPVDTARGISVFYEFKNLVAQRGRAKISTNQKIDTQSEFRLSLNKPEVIIRKAIFKEGALNFNMESYFSEKLNINLDMPTVTLLDGGGNLVISFAINEATGGQPGTSQKNYPLPPYLFELKTNASNENNILPVNVSANVNVGQNAFVSFDVDKDSLVMSMNFTESKLRKLEGFFGTDSIAIDTTLNVLDSSLFKDLKNTNITLDDVTFKISIENTLGAPAKVSMDITSYNAVNNTEKIIQESLLIKKAIDMGSKPVAVDNTFVLDKQKMSNLISNLPKRLKSSMRVETNPIEDPDRINNFLYDESAIDGKLLIEVPLSVIMAGLELETESEFNMSIPDQVTHIQSGELQINIDNRFPVSVTLSIALLDNAGNKLTNLTLNPSTINGGTPQGANGKVLSPTRSVIKVPVDQALFDNLRKAKKLKVNVVLNTPEPQTKGVKIFKDYDVSFSVAADLKFEVETGK